MYYVLDLSICYINTPETSMNKKMESVCYILCIGKSVLANSCFANAMLCVYATQHGRGLLKLMIGIP